LDKQQIDICLNTTKERGDREMYQLSDYLVVDLVVKYIACERTFKILSKSIIYEECNKGLNLENEFEVLLEEDELDDILEDYFRDKNDIQNECILKMNITYHGIWDIDGEEDEDDEYNDIDFKDDVVINQYSIHTIEEAIGLGILSK
jgi:hypothetical protein